MSSGHWTNSEQQLWSVKAQRDVNYSWASHCWSQHLPDGSLIHGCHPLIWVVSLAPKARGQREWPWRPLSLVTISCAPASNPQLRNSSTRSGGDSPRPSGLSRMQRPSVSYLTAIPIPGDTAHTPHGNPHTWIPHPHLSSSPRAPTLLQLQPLSPLTLMTFMVSDLTFCLHSKVSF